MKHSVNSTDLILKNATVLTMNAEKEIFEQGAIVIQGKKSAAVGDQSLAEKFHAHTILDVDGDIVMPGMINAHTHVSMIVFRSLADDVPDRLHRFIFPLEKKMVSPEMVSMLTRLEWVL
jgi:cytosine/adenosine deaminase-related metal-dependent hydrolase